MSVYLKEKDLRQEVGRELLGIAIRICADGKLDLLEIKELWKWLRNHKESAIPSVAYLLNIINRITSDKVIDNDELMELHLAVERIIPTAMRPVASQARKDREKEAVRIKKEQLRESKRLEKERKIEEKKAAKEELKKFKSLRWNDIEDNRHMPLRYTFANVAGISFQNDDFSERQEIASRCAAGEYFTLQHDPNNSFSCFATKVLRNNTGEQVGFVPEHLAQILCDESQWGHRIFGLVKERTGGDEFRNFGINFLVFIVKRDIDQVILTEYIREVYRLTI